MTTFDERESAFENKFAHDAELEFRADVKRNKLLSYWASAQLGKSAEEAAAYAKEMIAIEVRLPGNAEIERRITADLGDKSSAEEVAKKSAEFLAEARQMVRDGES